MLRILCSCAALIVAVFLTACDSVSFTEAKSDHSNPPAIIKSDNDPRDYRYLVLSNKLQVLLISDPQSDKSAAALDVHVGSAADPAEYLGLAHFLEHMLFLGTEKYPQAGEYQEFISAHAGNHNAFTSFEHTNYFFDIDPGYLEPALDRFAQFFIAPLFTEQYVEREKNAVHSEFMAKIKDDQRRSLDVLKTQVNPNHPFAKFSVGNLETLAETAQKPPLREQLMAFHQQYYSANMMTLVVLGQESLSQLEQMVREKFSIIKNNNQHVPSISEPLFTSSGKTLPLWINIQPEQQLRKLTIAFPTDDVMPFYRQKPLDYIGNILGHEGSGSLLSWLKHKGWAEALSAGAGLDYRGGSSFDITIKLTKEGVESANEVVVAVFQAVNRIRQADNQSWLYDEQKQLAEQGFRYRENFSAFHYVTTLASNMHYYSPEDILSGSYLMSDYNGPLIQKFLDEIAPTNCVVTLTAPEVAVNQRSHFYQTPYSIVAVAKAQLQRWQQAGINDQIQLPAPNPFIAEDLSLKFSRFDHREQEIYESETPALIEQGKGYKLWYKADSKFRLPKASILIGVNSPVAADTPEREALLRMYTALVSDQLNELSYPAQLAGLGYGITPGSNGLSVQISGFNDKQHLLLQHILAVLGAGKFQPERFENLKKDHIRQLQNARKGQPYQRAVDQLAVLLYRQQHSADELLEAYSGMTLQQLTDYQRQLLAQTELSILVHGNYRLSEAQSIAAMARQVLLKKPWQASASEITRIDSSGLLLPVISDYNDSAMLLYLQGADLSRQTRAAMGMSSQILRSDFYTQLRTEKQLGYIVTSGAYPVFDVPGIFFLVQSPVVGAGALQQEIMHYLQAQAVVADELSAESFERYRAALISRLSEEPKNLWQQSQQYWSDIVQHYDAFDSRQQLLDALAVLTLEQWRDLFKQQIVSLQRAVWIYSKGKFAKDRPIGDEQEDLPRVKDRLPYYHFP